MFYLSASLLIILYRDGRKVDSFLNLRRVCLNIFTTFGKISLLSAASPKIAQIGAGSRDFWGRPSEHCDSLHSLTCRSSMRWYFIERWAPGRDSFKLMTRQRVDISNINGQHWELLELGQNMVAKTLTLFGSGCDFIMPGSVRFTFLIRSQDVVKKLPSESS